MAPQVEAHRLVELKARCEDPEGCEDWLRARASRVGEVVQADTYFCMPRGRLKLREVEGASGAQLVFYLREDLPGPKGSRIRLARVEDAAALRRLLADSLGVRVVVRKVRRIYRWGTVQVHVDRVEGLGSFVEFERPVASDEDEEAVQEEFRFLREALGLRDADLVAGSYSDLPAAKGS